MSFKVDSLSSWMAVKAEGHSIGPPSPTDVHNVFEELAVELACLYCGGRKKGPSRTVSIDTLDLDTRANFRNGYTAYKTVAVDTSDLDVHYEFYKFEETRMSKSVATDTYDLGCKKTTLNNYGYRQGQTWSSTDHGCQNTRHESISFDKGNLELDCTARFEQNPYTAQGGGDNSRLGDLCGRIAAEMNPESDDPGYEATAYSDEENHDSLYGNRVETDGAEGVQYECSVCKASFTCKQVLSDHLAGHDSPLSENVRPVGSRADVGPYRCKHCSRSFAFEKQIKLHRCSKTECRICTQRFSSSEILDEHTRTFHQEFKSEDACGSSKVASEVGRELDSSACCITDKETDCAVQGETECKDGGRTKQEWKKDNIVSKKKLPRTPIECLTCGKVFRGWSALKNHETVHTGERNFVCEVCNKAFPTKACLKSHGSTHTGLKPFVCITCSKAFAHKDSLRTHIRTHTGERPFRCDLCGQAFNRSFTLNMHRRTHTGEKKHICPSCGQAFTTNSALRSHERRKHSINPPPKVHRVYKRCSRDPYICDVCGKACTSSANLRFHSANHTGIKPFGCTVCGKSYPMKQTLQRHMMKHTGERPFICDICGMAFFRSTTLNIHKLRHTGEKPHVCSLCGKGFIQSSSLSYHIRNHNRPPKPEPKTKRRRKQQKNSVPMGDEIAPHVQNLPPAPLYQETSDIGCFQHVCSRLNPQIPPH